MLLRAKHLVLGGQGTQKSRKHSFPWALSECKVGRRAALRSVLPRNGPTTTRLRARRAGRPRGVTRRQPYLSRELRRQITYTTPAPPLRSNRQLRWTERSQRNPQDSSVSAILRASQNWFHRSLPFLFLPSTSLQKLCVSVNCLILGRRKICEPLYATQRRCKTNQTEIG